MAKRRGLMSIADLERVLDERKSLLRELAKRRDALQRELDDVTDQLQGIVGGDLGRRRAKGRGRGPVPGQKRPKNSMPLRDAIQQILSKNKKGLSLDDLAEKVLQTGYKTNAKNFPNIVYQNIYKTKEISQDKDTGLYRIV